MFPILFGQVGAPMWRPDRPVGGRVTAVASFSEGHWQVLAMATFWLSRLHVTASLRLL